MAVLVLAAIAGGIYYRQAGRADGQAGDRRERTDRSPTGGDAVDRRPPDYPTVEPWTGSIAGRTGALRTGMPLTRVREQFGQPAAAHKQFDRGVLVLEYLDNPERAGAFRYSGGAALIVHVDLDTNRVVWFNPPDRPLTRRD